MSDELKKLRDEVASRIFIEVIVVQAEHRALSGEDVRLLASMSFIAAEAFLAARYDQDMKKGSLTT